MYKTQYTYMQDSRTRSEVQPEMQEMITKISREHHEDAQKRRGPSQDRFPIPTWYMQQIWAMLSFLWVALRDARDVWETLPEEERFPPGGPRPAAVDEKPKVLVPASPGKGSGHRYFVKKLTKPVKTLVQKENEGVALRPGDELPIGFPTETTHCLADSVVEGVLNAVLGHICMWDAFGPLSGTKPSTFPVWNHAWWWMATFTTQSDGTREITGSRLTREKRQLVIQETLQAIREYEARAPLFFLFLYF